MTQWFIWLLCVCVCVCVCARMHIGCDSSRHAHICAPSPSSCVSQMSRQMFRRSHAIGLVLTVVHFSPLPRRGPIASVLINTRRSNKVKVGCFGCGLLRVAPLLFCLFVMFFSFSFSPLLPPPSSPHRFSFVFSQPAYRLLYYSWTHYCFWLMQKMCSPSYTSYSPHTSTLQGLIYNLAGLNFKITAGFRVHN